MPRPNPEPIHAVLERIGERVVGVTSRQRMRINGPDAFVGCYDLRERFKAAEHRVWLLRQAAEEPPFSQTDMKQMRPEHWPALLKRISDVLSLTHDNAFAIAAELQNALDKSEGAWAAIPASVATITFIRYLLLEQESEGFSERTSSLLEKLNEIEPPLILEVGIAVGGLVPPEKDAKFSSKPLRLTRAIRQPYREFCVWFQSYINEEVWPRVKNEYIEAEPARVRLHNALAARLGIATIEITRLLAGYEAGDNRFSDEDLALLAPDLADQYVWSEVADRLPPDAYRNLASRAGLFLDPGGKILRRASAGAGVGVGPGENGIGRDLG